MIQSYERSTFKRDVAFAVFAVGAVAATSILGQIATYPNLSPWYAGLAKPSFNPPNWVFAPVWTTLYALMAFALWRILRVYGPSGIRRSAIALFLILLASNATWSWMFFWAHSPLLGLVTIIVFAQLDCLAAICLVPLAAWVGFASVLNIAIWRLNG